MTFKFPTKLAVSCLALATLSNAVFTPKVGEPTSITLVKNATTSDGGHGELWEIAADGYSSPILLADLHSTDHYGAGYLYGQLLAAESIDNYNALLESLLGKDIILKDILSLFLDWQYNTYLVHGLPQEFVDEMRGYTDAGNDLHLQNLGPYVKRGVTLAAIATGDVADDIKYLLVNEFKHKLDASGMSAEAAANALVSALTKKSMFNSCSMFGIWGSRTANGKLFTGRNLDWESSTGISNHKVVTVYHIGTTHAYASVAFAGTPGAITGMSSAGLTVHEAGDDSTAETLKGFVWHLRLRYVMENAANLAEAKALWAKTNNTLGINHGIGSSSDGRFDVIETNAEVSAWFQDNDPREAALVVNGTHYGFPLADALWRTNHGYDPTFLKTAVEGMRPSHDSQTRYLLIHDTIELYQTTMAGAASDMQAINITAVAGDKGDDTRDSFLTCEGPTAQKGANVISATFVPGDALMYLAYEDGLEQNNNHVPACCNTYVKLDMSRWF